VIQQTNRRTAASFAPLRGSPPGQPVENASGTPGFGRILCRRAPAYVKLRGRESECTALDGLMSEALAGRSQVLVLRGEAGVGKSALIRYLEERAGDWQVAKCVGVESEMEIAYGGLHQLLAPLLGSVAALPEPQRDALKIVFGLSSGPAPDRFLVGLAALTLLADAAERGPLLCIVEDGQWLDQASAQTIGFFSRRLLAERIAVVAALRTGAGDGGLASLPNLSINGLGEADARALLLENAHGPIDAEVCHQIVTESRGNPLVLLELSRGMSAGELAGGFGLVDSARQPAAIEEVFSRRLNALPGDTRRLLLVAAADPVGDPRLLWRAANQLGIDASAAAPAADQGLLTIGGQVRFRHPLVRSAAYHGAEPADRRAAHLALAEVTDREADPDRRAWHLATAAVGPNEDVALELERSADRARARGGLAAASAFLARAVALTDDSAVRTKRALRAAWASFHAGAFEMALELVGTAESRPDLDSLQRAQLDLLRAQVAFASGAGGDTAARLLAAAQRLGQFDPMLSRETYLIAWRAALVGGQGDLAVEICRRARRLPETPEPQRPIDLLLDGLSLCTVEGLATALPVLRRAAQALDTASTEDVVRWGWVAAVAHATVWDIDGLLNTRHAEIVRAAGALAELPIHISGLGLTAARIGDFERAAAMAAEQDAVAAATGSDIAPFILLRLRALQGEEGETAALLAAVSQRAPGGGYGLASIHADWARALLANGLGRYPEAVAAAERVASNLDFWGGSYAWVLPEVVEAAVRTGDAERARRAAARLLETTQPLAADYPLGIEARCGALLADGDEAERLYREAVERLGRTPLRPELARAHLLYGEWLRREGRRIDAREQLETAYDLFTEIGMEAFAERTRRELLATGGIARKRTPQTRDAFTPQERQIALQARDGLSNAEIGARLFLSPRTVEWHLRNVFAKLGIASRRELRSALPDEETLP
jgi:DNA-binding CsgD family transcriptional regulator